MSNSILDEFEYDPPTRERAISTKMARKNAKFAKSLVGGFPAQRWRRELIALKKAAASRKSNNRKEDVSRNSNGAATGPHDAPAGTNGPLPPQQWGRPI